MLNFFKSFGKGVLYVLVLPFLLVGLAIYAVVAFFVFLFLSIKGLILFFTGRSLYEDMPEDKEAKRRLAFANGESVDEPKETAEPEEENEQVPEDEEEESEDEIENDPFYVPEYLRTEEQKVQLEQQEQEEQTSLFEEETPAVEEPIEQQIEAPVEEPIEEPKIEKNPQNAGILDINKDEYDDFEDDDSGVEITLD